MYLHRMADPTCRQHGRGGVQELAERSGRGGRAWGRGARLPAHLVQGAPKTIPPLSHLALAPIPMAVEEPRGSTLLSLSPADLITSRRHQAASKKDMRSAKHVARQPS